MNRYLLSSGESTSKLEYYIIDLFKINLNVWPNDIPHTSDIGFDFILTGVTKDNLTNEVKSRINSLIRKIQKKFETVTIAIETLDIIDEETIKLVISVNKEVSDEMTVNITQQG